MSELRPTGRRGVVKPVSKATTTVASTALVGSHWSTAMGPNFGDKARINSAPVDSASVASATELHSAVEDTQVNDGTDTDDAVPGNSRPRTEVDVRENVTDTLVGA